MNSTQQNQIIQSDSSGFSVSIPDKPVSYTPAHWHREIELVLMTKGRAVFGFDNGSRQIKAGEMLIINPFEVHESRFTRNAVYLSVHIEPGAMCRFSPKFDQLFFSLSYDPGSEEHAKACRELSALMKELSGQKSNSLLRQAMLFRIASLLEQFFSTSLSMEEAKLRRGDMERLEPILEYIRLHHADDLMLEGAADAMGLNKDYFCRLFKKNMGITHLQYIYQVRAAAVCRDLEYTDDPIGEISERHGFKDSKTLNQYFKELYGCTPSEKRKLFRELSADDSDNDLI